jgi:hypothetical protein
LDWAGAQDIIRRQLNDGLAVDADAFHWPAMDDWATFNSDVAFRLIVGTGETKTPGILKEFTIYDLDGLPHTYFDMKMVNGDGTVPLPSASLRGNGVSMAGDTAIWYTRGLNHGDLAKEGYVVDFVGSLLATPPDLDNTRNARASSHPIDPDAEPLYTGPDGRFSPPRHADNTPPPPPEMSTTPFAVSGGQITVIGEAQLHVYDSFDRHTGPLGNGSHEVGIPDSSYIRVETSTIITVPEGDTYRVEVVSGGSETVDVRFESLEGIEGNLVQRNINYADAPVGAAGVATTVFEPLGFGAAPDLFIDSDNDGATDGTMPPTGDVDGAESADFTGPTVSAALDGSQDVWGNFHGPVLVTLAAADGESGVSRIAYSLGEGQPEHEYAGPFMVEATTVSVIVVHATDSAGNERWEVVELKPNSPWTNWIPAVLNR